MTAFFLEVEGGAALPGIYQASALVGLRFHAKAR